MTSYDVVVDDGSREAKGTACRSDDRAALASISYASDDDKNAPVDVVAGKTRPRSGGKTGNCCLSWTSGVDLVVAAEDAVSLP